MCQSDPALGVALNLREHIQFMNRTALITDGLQICTDQELLKLMDADSDGKVGAGLGTLVGRELATKTSRDAVTMLTTLLSCLAVAQVARDEFVKAFEIMSKEPPFFRGGGASGSDQGCSCRMHGSAPFRVHCCQHRGPLSNGSDQVECL